MTARTNQRLHRNDAGTLASLLGVLFVLLVQAPSNMAMAQASASESGIAADLSRAVQAQARAALERHLKPMEFQAFAKVTPADSIPSIPYLPETFAPIAGADVPPESLAPLVKRIEIEVVISDLYDDAAKTKLKSIVWKTLRLNDARGDKVTFSSLGLKIERPESALSRDLARSEADARDSRAKLETVSREREDAKREASDAKRDLTTAKTELDRVNRTKAAAPDSRGGDVAPPQVPGEVKSFWREHSALIVGTLIALLAIFASSATFRGASKALSEAVQSIGLGLPILGEKLSQSLAQAPQAFLPAGGSNAQGDSGRSTVQGAHLNGTSMPMEAVSKRVIELHVELSDAVDASNEPLVLEYLSYLLEDDRLVSRAVATMELLGKEKANYLYNCLGASHQQKVFSFLKSGNHGRSKGEVMLEAGEELKTKLFGASFSSRAQLGEVVSKKLLLLGIEDQVAVVRSLEGPSLSRLFLYLEPAKTGLLLSKLREKDPERFHRTAALVVKQPEVETSTNLDQDIITAIEGQLARASADIQAPYLAHYKTIVESVDEDVGESLTEHFAAAHPRVERYIRETIVSFGTFFKLHGDIQEEIISVMTNKDLAALTSTLKPEHKVMILSHVEDRRKELVEEEFDRLAAKGPRQSAAAHRAAKQLVTQRIIQIRGNGPLSDLLTQSSEGHSIVPVKPNQRAA